MIAAGFGCRKGTSAQALLAALDEACGQAGISRESIAALATGDIKRQEPGLIELAARLALPLHTFDDSALKKADGRTRTISRHSLAHTSTPSLCEAAALVAAGEESELVIARVITYGATCALARSNGSARDYPEDQS